MQHEKCFFMAKNPNCLVNRFSSFSIFTFIFTAVCMTGVCLNEEGSKLNRAYVDLPGQYSKRACLSECQRKRKSVGYKMSACEYMKDGSCKVHTLTASAENLNSSATCCIYDSGIMIKL